MPNYLIQPKADFDLDPDDISGAVWSVGTTDPTTISGLTNGTEYVAREFILSPASAGFTPSGALTSSGAIALAAATVAGTAERILTASGAVTLASTTVAGTAARGLTSSGAVSVPAITTAGTATAGAGGGYTASYAANSIEPELVADFPSSFYATASAADTFAGMFTFARSSTATYVDSSGVVQTATSGTARTAHHRWNGSGWVNKGLRIESEARTNLLLNSGTLSTQNVTVSAVQYVLSFTGTGTVTLSGASTAGPLVGTGTGENNRVQLAFTPSAGTLTCTVSGTVTNAQLEAVSTASPYASSYIPTTGATATRAAETIYIAGADTPANTTAISIAIRGELTYGDDDTFSTVDFYEWQDTTARRLRAGIHTNGGLRTGEFFFEQQDATTISTARTSATYIDEGQNLAFEIAARHTSSGVNGAESGTALTLNAATSLWDVSTANFDIGQKFMGTIDTIIIWGDDIGDVGIEEAST